MSTVQNVPVITQAKSTLDIAAEFQERTQDVLEVCYDFYGKRRLKITDHYTRKWLNKADIPYKAELLDVAKEVDSLGVLTLNLSYEWGCTTLALEDQPTQSMKMFRALDWPIPHLGNKLMVARKEGKAGEYWDITFPGFVGVLNGMAPDRFTIAINQAPLPQWYLTRTGNWMVARVKTGRNFNTPPTFLLRKVFEEASNFAEAREMLANTPTCAPAIYTIAGVNPGESCVIERQRDEAIIHDDLPCAGNHWLNNKWNGMERLYDSKDRVKLLGNPAAGWKGDFDWLVDPVLNFKTRIVFEANAAQGTLQVAGFEGDEATTNLVQIDAKAGGKKGAPSITHKPFRFPS